MTMTTTTDDKLGPDSWDAYIGQDALKARLDAHITAAIQDYRPLEHILLDGPPGSGKTTLANIIAARLTDPIVHLNRPVPMRQLVEALFELGAGILFIDEIQSWSKSQRESLLGLLEERRLTTDWGTVEAPCVTVIVATTERGQLGEAFEDRFLIQTWDPYTEEELEEIITAMAARAEVDLTDEVAKGIAKASCGSPRECRKLVYAARALASTFDDDDRWVTMEEILHHAQIEADGLGRSELAYLRLLQRQAVPVGLEVIVDSLGVHRTRARSIERLLVDRNLVMRTKSGRVLTAEGRRRIAGDVVPSRMRQAS